jgi:hypothetical protein
MVRSNFDMTEWCVAILIKIYQNNEGTEQNFARLLQMLNRTKINFARLLSMLIRTKIKLCDALTEFTWVTLEEAKQYDLIDGIYDELEILDNFLKTGKHIKWERNKA